MELVRIEKGDYNAVINLTRGANCISLRNEKHGVSILREPDYNNPDSPYLHGMPILFPQNRIEGGTFEFEGRKYSLAVNEPATGCHLHGELHRMQFKLSESSAERVLCSYVASKESPYLTFGHDFEIRLEYVLSEHGLTQNTEIINLSEQNMPCMLGFHTTFNADFAGRDNVKVMAQISEEYERAIKTTYLPTGKKLEFDDASKRLSCGDFPAFGIPISRHYSKAREGKMEILNLKRGLKVVYENDEKYGFRLIYNGKADGYICLEPQSCIINAPNMPQSNSDSGFCFIKPGESKIYTSKIYIAEINKEE